MERMIEGYRCSQHLSWERIETMTFEAALRTELMLLPAPKLGED